MAPGSSLQPAAFALARSKLPLWVVWGPAVRQPVLGFALGYLIARVLSWRYLREPPSGHWSERARLLYSQRVELGITILYLALFTGAFAWAGMSELHTASQLPSPLVGGLAGVATLVGTGYGSRPFLRSWQPQSTAGARWRSRAFVLLGRFPHLILGLTGAAVLPQHGWTPGTWVLFASLFIGIGVASFGGGFWLLTVMGILETAGPKLQEAVARASAVVGVTPRAVFEIRAPWVNLFALPTLQFMVASTRATELLDADQLAAVVSHELGHLSESGRFVAARVLGASTLTWVLLMIQPLIGWLGPLAGLGVIVLAVTLGRLLGRMGRHLEKHADDVATAHWAATYARGLERLYEVNMIPAVVRRKPRATGHPELYDRIVAAGVTPDFPRPAPPPRRWRWCAGLLVTACTLELALSFGLPLAIAKWRPEDPTAALAVVAWTGGSRHELWNAGRLAELDGDPWRAWALKTLAGAAAASSPRP